MLVVVHILTKVLERRSRSANTFENIYYGIRATQIQIPDGITDGTTGCEADDFLCGQWRACTPIDKQKKQPKQIARCRSHSYKGARTAKPKREYL